MRPVFAQQNQIKYEWHIELTTNSACDGKDFSYSYDEEGNETANWFDAPDTSNNLISIIAVLAPTFTIQAEDDTHWICYGEAPEPTFPNGKWVVTVTNSDNGENFLIYTGDNAWNPRVSVVRGREIKLADFCDVVIVFPIPSYDSLQHIERIKNTTQRQLDINLIGDYSIPTIASLPLNIGTYHREINLGGLYNIRFFFYSMILWRVFFGGGRR